MMRCLYLSLTIGVALAVGRAGSGAELKGERYEAEVPDTLDLAERARIAINGLTGICDPRYNYEPPTQCFFYANPAFMPLTSNGGTECWGKVVEALFEMRVMSGSEEHKDVDEKTLEGMLSCLADDDLFYCKAEGRPWHTREDYACVVSQARAMLAVMTRYQIDPQPRWRKMIERLRDGMAKVVLHKDDYAYYPDNPKVHVGGAISREKSGWKTEDEPPPPMHDTMRQTQGTVIRVLTRWYVMSGDKESLELARKLKNYLIKAKNWTSEAEPRAVVGSELAHFKGHHHSACCGLMGLLEFAIATNDARLKEFVRNGYQYIRNFGLARIGLFGEQCTTGDMTFMAIRLTDAGAGDFWEDVDQYVRNHLTATQILRPDLLKKVSEAGPKDKTVVDPDWEVRDRVIEKNVGCVLSDATHPTLIPENSVRWTVCCQGNAVTPLYFAWEAIVRYEAGAAEVNLLLNRASPWLDIDSHLPYEGKVVMKNKTAEKVSVRIPRWVDRKAIKSKINERGTSPFWVGNYLVFDGIAAKDVITVEFPMVETTEEYTLGWSGLEDYPMGWTEETLPKHKAGEKEVIWERPRELDVYTCHFKGNTLVDISPRAEGVVGYPLYLRDHYKKDKAPMRKVTRYIAPKLINWR